jgi:hypothetical protein
MKKNAKREREREREKKKKRDVKETTKDKRNTVRMSNNEAKAKENKAGSVMVRNAQKPNVEETIFNENIGRTNRTTGGDKCHEFP